MAPSIDDGGNATALRTRAQDREENGLLVNRTQQWIVEIMAVLQMSLPVSVLLLLPRDRSITMYQKPRARRAGKGLVGSSRQEISNQSTPPPQKKKKLSQAWGRSVTEDGDIERVAIGAMETGLRGVPP